MLTADEIAFYRENGYLMIENAVSAGQLDRLREITYALIEKSRPAS
mgnify:FL=1